jgi:CHAT domain-containing protein
MILSLSTETVASSNNTTIAQIQQVSQGIQAPSPNLSQAMLNYATQAYNWVISVIQNILKNNSSKARPSIGECSHRRSLPQDRWKTCYLSLKRYNHQQKLLLTLTLLHCIELH